ncbi:MAG: glycoside hydrolase family 31 protein [Firmicutes bacterium]|uniref:glycoside hydrolase family 31 protein n=1 Tax=Limnochorda pilosa TaxID=1555112 RepID=UPI0018419A5A|nr:glycoside hydrolase family 31 protein [Limnochorda pilosa]NMA70802.1 glycoside hydrolase family 31 protein [Bacillota bacterium]
MDPAYRALGRAQSVRWTSTGVVLEAPPARLEIRCLAPDLIRVELIPRPDLPEPLPFSRSETEFPPPAVTQEEQDGRLILATEAVRVEIETDPIRLTFRDGEGRVIDRDDPELGMGWRYETVHTFRQAQPGERVYGLGEKTGHLDKRGRRWTMWARDVLPHLPTTDPLYQAIPFYLVWKEGRVHGFFLENTFRSHFDMDSDGSGRYHIWAEGGRLVYYLLAGPTFPQVLERYTQLTGRMPLPPRWSLGYHQSRWGYLTQQEVAEVARTFRERRLPCDVIHLDIDYMDGFRVFTWHPNRFPDPEALCARLKEQGFRVVTIVDPGVKKDPSYAFFQEGLEAGLYVEAPSGEPVTGQVWPGEVHFPDFLQERTRRWWGDAHRALLDRGVAGIWNDMNEPVIFDARDEDRTLPETAVHRTDQGEVRQHREVHNLYGLLMGKATYEGLRRLRPEERPFLLTRSGFAGIQRYAAVWTGDNSSWWEHLAMSIPMLLNLGLSGVAFVGPDIGGFSEDATPELMVRWMQLGAFYPFCRNHSAKTFRRQEPWTFGPEVEALAREALELRYQLLPYLYTRFWEAHTRGWPIMRPLVWHAPDDPVAARTEDAFFVGADLLVAPVLQPGARERLVYLPQGEWVDFWTGTCYEGGAHQVVEAPLERIPLFVRAGAALPLGPVIQHTGEAGWARLILRLFPGTRPSRWQGTLYEDDGASLAYEQGVSSRRSLQVTVETDRLLLEVGEPQGPYRPDREVIQVELPFLAEPPRQVRLDGRAVPTATLVDRERNLLRVALSQEGAHRLEIAW